MSNETNDPQDDIEVVEVVTSAVGDDGTVVVDDLVAIVDADGNVLATDETIAVEAPDGTIVVDEVVSVADDDGDLVAIEEDVIIVEGESALNEWPGHGSPGGPFRRAACAVPPARGRRGRPCGSRS